MTCPDFVGTLMLGFPNVRFMAAPAGFVSAKTLLLRFRLLLTLMLKLGVIFGLYMILLCLSSFELLA